MDNSDNPVIAYIKQQFENGDITYDHIFQYIEKHSPPDSIAANGMIYMQYLADFVIRLYEGDNFELYFDHITELLYLPETAQFLVLYFIYSFPQPVQFIDEIIVLLFEKFKTFIYSTLYGTEASYGLFIDRVVHDYHLGTYVHILKLSELLQNDLARKTNLSPKDKFVFTLLKDFFRQRGNKSRRLIKAAELVNRIYSGEAVATVLQDFMAHKIKRPELVEIMKVVSPTFATFMSHVKPFREYNNKKSPINIETLPLKNPDSQLAMEFINFLYGTYYKRQKQGIHESRFGANLFADNVPLAATAAEHNILFSNLMSRKIYNTTTLNKYYHLLHPNSQSRYSHANWNTNTFKGTVPPRNYMGPRHKAAQAQATVKVTAPGRSILKRGPANKTRRVKWKNNLLNVVEIRHKNDEPDQPLWDL